MTRIDLHFPASKDAEKALLLAAYNAKVNSGRIRRVLESAETVETEGGTMRRASLLSIPFDSSKAIRDALNAQNHGCELIVETKSPIGEGGLRKNGPD